MQVQIFNKPDFGDVRVVMKDGAPWFVAADVCRVLELADVSSALRKLDEDEKGTIAAFAEDGKRISRKIKVEETPPCLSVAVDDLLKWLADEQRNST